MHEPTLQRCNVLEEEESKSEREVGYVRQHTQNLCRNLRIFAPNFCARMCDANQNAIRHAQDKCQGWRSDSDCRREVRLGGSNATQDLGKSKHKLLYPATASTLFTMSMVYGKEGAGAHNSYLVTVYREMMFVCSHGDLLSH